MSYPKYEKPYAKEIKIGDKVIKVEVGRFSQQAAAAVLLTCGETVIHTTIGLGRKVDWGYFPLSVDFAEKLYAGGIIKGSRWVKRDGRPTDEAILKARLIDRSIRPLFPEGITNEVQVINTVFSYDGENDADMLGLLGTALALSISQIPFDGPMAGVRIGYNQESSQYLVNPTNSERESSQLDLIVSGSGEAIVMVEAGAKEAGEDIVLGGILHAQKVLGEVCTQVSEVIKEVGKEKVDLLPQKDEVKETLLTTTTTEIAKTWGKQIREMVEKTAHLEDVGTEAVVEEIMAKLSPEESKESEEVELSAKMVGSIIQDLMKKEARRMILEDGVRPDGRKTDEIRPIWSEVDIFPRTHGSAMFKRGATQAVTVTTLASPSKAQLVEDINGEKTHSYFHHYNMPPYASGEAGRFGFPKRREIGHGALAQKALEPVLPDQENFPYTIHVVSEILSSNGSTSQASVCGSTLSLMAAGVPIKKPVSGIAMGMMSDGVKKYVVLSDIQGLEDHVGDMDFKVAGTKDGITAIQMDIKLKGIPVEVLKQALEQAKIGRLHIMAEMLKAIPEKRAEISKYAPKIKQITIPTDKIGELIGPGGKMIKSIIEQTGAEIDVDEDEEKGVGLVNISSPDQEKIDHAIQIVENMMRVVEVGDEFDGTVNRIENYGAFVEYLPGRDGLVHVSAMSAEYVNDPNEVVKLGDKVHVRVSEIKDDGKIGMSMLTKEQEEAAKSQRGGGGRPGGSGGDRGGRPSGRFDRRPSSGPRQGGYRSFGDRSGGSYDRRPSGGRPSGGRPSGGRSFDRRDGGSRSPSQPRRFDNNARSSAPRSDSPRRGGTDFKSMMTE